MGDGKTSPFAMDGKGGAEGNGQGGGGKGLFRGLEGHRGCDEPQRIGPPMVNTDSIPKGGRVLKLDPPNDRQGLIGQTATTMRKPFKLNGSGPAMPAENAEVTEAGPAGDVPTEDTED